MLLIGCSASLSAEWLHGGKRGGASPADEGSATDPDDATSPPAPTSPPTVDAGADRRVRAAVTLTANASAGATLTWRVVTGPGAATLVADANGSANLNAVTADGTYTLEVTATNPLGSASDTVDVFWDGTPPSTQLTQGAATGPRKLSAGSFTLGGTATDALSTVTSVRISLANAAGQCLNPGLTAFAASCPAWLTPTGVGAWTQTLAGAVFSEGTYQLTIEATDDVGNSGEATTPVLWDTTAPSVTAVHLAADAATVNNPRVAVDVTAAGGSGAAIEALYFAEPTSDCAASPGELGWQTYAGNGAFYTFVLTRISGPHTVCAWARDAAGNVSQISAGGVGTANQDKDDVTYAPLAAPVVNDFLVVKSAGGGKTAAAGDVLRITWDVTAAAGLTATPIVALEATTDGTTWAQVPAANAPASTYGTVAAGTTNWSSTYTGAVAPSAAPFMVRMTVEDRNGERAVVTSNLMNGGNWDVWAGIGGYAEGASAKGAILGSFPAVYSTFLRSEKTGDFYVMERNVGLRRINAATGVVTTIAQPGLATNWLGQVSLAADAAGYIYFPIDGAVQRFDPAAANPALETYYTEQAVGALPLADATVWHNSALAFDGSDNLYLVVGGANAYGSQQGLSVLKIARNGLNAGAPTHLAGNGAWGFPTSGQTAVTEPLSLYYQATTSIAANADGSVVYLVDYTTTAVKIVGGLLYTDAALKKGVVFRNPHGSGASEMYNAQVAVSSDPTLYRFQALASSAAETLVPEIGGSAAAGCRDDAVLTTNACVFPSGGLSFDAAGHLFFNDAGWLNARAPTVIKTVQNGRIYHLFGATVSQGLGGNRRFAAFSDVGRPARDTSGRTYIPDGALLTVSKVESGATQLDPFLGNGNPLDDPQVGQSYVSQGVGPTYSGGNVMYIAVDPTDQVYYRAGHFMYKIDTGGVVRQIGTGATTMWQTLADGAPFPGYQWVNLGGAGFEFFSNGDVALTNCYAVSTWPAVLRLVVADETLHKVAGKTAGAGGITSNLPSPDNSTAVSSTFQCAYTTADWSISTIAAFNDTGHIRVYSDVLYFTEGTNLRYIDGTGKMQTVLDGNSNPVNDLLPPANAFVIRNNRLHYFSTPRTLSCRWLGAGAPPADCPNTAVTVPSLLPSPLMTGHVARLLDAGPDGLLMSTGNLLLQYAVP